VEDRYTGGEAVFDRAADLLGACVLSPYLEKGAFAEKYVRSECENLADRIKAQLNDKVTYAMRRMAKLMYGDEPCALSELGEEEDARRVDARGLYAYYEKLLSAAPVELFYCGACGHDRARDALNRVFAALPRTDDRRAVKNALYAGAQPIRNFEDRLDVTQGKLSMGFRTGLRAGKTDRAALMLLNAAFGGSLNSKLFLNVRERLSLCYYASSRFDRLKGTISVNSGVAFENFDVTRDEILNQLEACRRGDITESELEGARAYLVSSLKSMEDSQASMEEFYLSQGILGASDGPRETAEAVGRVTLEEVVGAARDVELDCVYCLRGEAEA